MHEIDLRTWRRRQHFDLFNTFNHPHLNMCANLELTAFRQHVRDSGVSFTVAFVYGYHSQASRIRCNCIQRTPSRALRGASSSRRVKPSRSRSAFKATMH